MKKLLYLTPLVMLNASATTVAGFDTEVYGFLKASAEYSDKALASYNNINLSAPTHTVAQTRSLDKSSRTTFQAQQSRIGFNLKKEQIFSKFEFDFIDFNKSSPTTQMNPRVRIASVTYAWDNNKVIIGQDWDMFSPVTTYTFDYVGLYFLAGNAGFMRQQAQFLHDTGNWELGAALGMAGNNPGVTDADLETGKSPTGSLRLTRKLEQGRVGASAIYTSLHYDSNGTRHDAYGYNLFYEKIYGTLGVKAEAYYGQNLSNIGALTIGKGTSTTNVREYGATLTANYQLAEKHFIFGGGGFAKVDNKNDVTAFSQTGGVVSAPGILHNIVTRVGWDYRITKELSWISEIGRMDTLSKVAANSNQLNIAGTVETGIQLRF